MAYNSNVVDTLTALAMIPEVGNHERFMLASALFQSMGLGIAGFRTQRPGTANDERTAEYRAALIQMMTTQDDVVDVAMAEFPSVGSSFGSTVYGNVLDHVDLAHSRAARENGQAAPRPARDAIRAIRDAVYGRDEASVPEPAMPFPPPEGAGVASGWDFSASSDTGRINAPPGPVMSGAYGEVGSDVMDAAGLHATQAYQSTSEAQRAAYERLTGSGRQSRTVRWPLSRTSQDTFGYTATGTGRVPTPSPEPAAPLGYWGETEQGDASTVVSAARIQDRIVDMADRTGEVVIIRPGIGYDPHRPAGQRYFDPADEPPAAINGANF